MEYTAKQFTPQLEQHIHTVERSLQELLKSIYAQYKEAFDGLLSSSTATSNVASSIIDHRLATEDNQLS